MYIPGDKNFQRVRFFGDLENINQCFQYVEKEKSKSSVEITRSIEVVVLKKQETFTTNIKYKKKLTYISNERNKRKKGKNLEQC